MGQVDRILIVDDDRSTRRTLELILDKKGYEVDSAGTGQEALTKARDGILDAVLLDIRLPDVEGVELLAALKDLQPEAAVIMVTGHASVETAVRALEQGAAAFITKPLDLDQVLAKVGDVLEKQRLIEGKRRAEEALRQRNRELELLSCAAQAFSSSLDLDQVLNTILDQTCRLLGVAGASIWLIEAGTTSEERDQGELVCRQAVGPRSKFVHGWRLSAGDGIAGWVADIGESVIVPDARADERLAQEIGKQSGLEPRSVLSVPMRVKKEVIGVLQLVDTEADRFGASELTLLESLTASAAVAIDNARLYEQAQQEIAERVRAEQARERLIAELEEALTQVQQLEGFLPICSYCKKIRNDQNYWQQVETYIEQHSEALFTHSICPDCFQEFAVPELTQLRRLKENQ